MGEKKRIEVKNHGVPIMNLFQTSIHISKGLKTNSIFAMAKKSIQPDFYPEAKVYCDGKVVMKLGGSQKEYIVDLWSGNHPFFQGATNTVIVDKGQVNRFKKRFAGLAASSSVNTSRESKK